MSKDRKNADRNYSKSKKDNEKRLGNWSDSFSVFSLNDENIKSMYTFWPPDDSLINKQVENL